MLKTWVIFWLMAEKAGIIRIIVSAEKLKVEAKQLDLPQIVLNKLQVATFL